MNLDNFSKNFLENAQKNYLPESIIKNFNVIINRKIFYGQAIDYDIKRYEDIRKLATAQGEDVFLDDNYIKNHYRLIAVDLSRQNELDVDPKAIQQVEFVRQLKNKDSMNTYGTQSMLILTMLDKIKEMRLKFFK